ncbi:MAG: hypothetical protein AVDCRST_MAG59-913, partial [uncultured Thermomicrobiales bacterium]
WSPRTAATGWDAAPDSDRSALYQRRLARSAPGGCRFEGSRA